VTETPEPKPRELRRIFGENVRRFRLEQRYSERESAAIAGVSQKHLAKIEGPVGASAGLIKLPWHDGIGLCMLTKKLEHGQASSGPRPRRPDGSH
jgi:hypothetical protein